MGIGPGKIGTGVGGSAAGGGSGSVQLTTLAFQSVQSTNITIAANSSFVELAAESGGPGSGKFDLVVPNAKTGDRIYVSFNALLAPGSNPTQFDMATIVSGSVVHWLSNGTATGDTNGILGWWVDNPSGVAIPVGGASIPLTLASGDISAGNVTLRLYVANASTTRVFYCFPGASSPSLTALKISS